MTNKFILFKDGEGFAVYTPDDGQIRHALNLNAATEAVMDDWSDVLGMALGDYIRIPFFAASELEALQKEVERLNKFHIEDMRVTNESADYHMKQCAELRTQNQELRKWLLTAREYVARALKSNQEALKDADPDSQFYGEDIMSMPLLAKIDKALALKPETSKP